MNYFSIFAQVEFRTSYGDCLHPCRTFGLPVNFP
jgi:hypothetical protein